MQVEQVQKCFARHLFERNALNYDDRIKLLNIPSKKGGGMLQT